MKAAFFGFALLVSGGAMATVLEMEDATADSVIEVYEEMREVQVEDPADNAWIHEFEEDSVGSEMDHLTTLKRAPAIEQL